MPLNCLCNEDTPYKTMKQLSDDLMVSLGYAAQLASYTPGMELLLSQFLKNAHRFIIQKFPALRTERYFTWDLVVGQQFYELQANREAVVDINPTLPDVQAECNKRLDPYKITSVSYRETSTSQVYTLTRGIDAYYYSLNTTGAPIRFEIRQCLEVWPTPESAGEILVRGHYLGSGFEVFTDKPEIDDHLVYLRALAMLKAHYSHPDAGAYMSDYSEYLGELISGLHAGRRYLPKNGMPYDYIEMDNKRPAA